MATQIIAPGTSVASSSELTVAAGDALTVWLYVDSGDLPDGARAEIRATTPGASTAIGNLTPYDPVRQVAGPVTITVTRTSGGRNGEAVGVFSETVAD